MAATRAALEAGDEALSVELEAAAAFTKPVFTEIEPGEVETS